MAEKPEKSDQVVGNFGTPEKRLKLRLFFRTLESWRARCLAYATETGRNWRTFPEPSPVLPKELIGMRCGAKNRQGMPCKVSTLFSNGRCKFHGGASTGPKTSRGKRQSANNGFKPKAPKRSEKHHGARQDISVTRQAAPPSRAA